MPKIQFSNGQIIEFKDMPSMEDIDSAAKSLNLQPLSPETQNQPEKKQDGFLKSIAKDVAGTLVVNPITRATEAVTRTLAPNSMAAKGFEQMQDEGQGQNVLGVNVPSIGNNPTRQIAGEALKTASYLFPYGKAATAIGGAVGSKIAGNVASGAIGGFSADAGFGLTDESKTVGEALTPGLGTAIGGAIPLAGPIVRGAGRAIAKTGSKAVDVVIPNSAREAQILQTYKANNPFFKRVVDVLAGTEKAPQTASKTITEKGLMGTKSGIGVQAKRASGSLWNDVISPRLKQAEVQVDLPEYFNTIERKIVETTPEAGRQKTLLNALNSVRDDYAGTNAVSLEKLQKLKEGWAEFIPEKFYKGENIAGSAKQVNGLLAEEARQTIYNTLGDDVKQAYLDYGNLLGLQKMGQVSMTGQKLKGGTGGLVSEIFSQSVTPIGTVAGQGVYKLGKGIEFIGNLGAKNLGEALGVNIKFPGDAAVDDISASFQRAKNTPNKQGGFVSLGQDASLPTKTQSNQMPKTISNTVIPKSSTKSPKVSSAKEAVAKGLTEEQFVKGQGTPMFHQSQGKDLIDIFSSSNRSNKPSYSTSGEGIYFASNKKVAKEIYGGTTNEVRLFPKNTLDLGDFDAMYLDGRKVNYAEVVSKNFKRTMQGLDELPEPEIQLTKISKKAKKWLQSNGYDSVEGMKGEMSSMSEIVVLDDSIIKTTSQLRTEYQTALKANKK